MKHTLRCHGFGDAGQAARSGPAMGMRRAGSRGPKPRQPTRGCGQNRRRAGTWSRIAGERKRGPGDFRGSDLAGDRGRRSFASDSGRIPKSNWGPCSTSSAAPLAGCDRAGACEDRASGALLSRSGVASKHGTLGTCSALSGTLCRSACQYSEYWLHLASRYRRFWLATHARFIMLGALRGVTGAARHACTSAVPATRLAASQ